VYPFAGLAVPTWIATACRSEAKTAFSIFLFISCVDGSWLPIRPFPYPASP
jgi:hypothetical protein